MNKFTMIFIILLIPIIGFSQVVSIDLSKLPPEEAAKVLNAKRIINGDYTAKEMTAQVSEWANVGTNLGKAMVSAAKEVGIATNEFVDTPIGKLTAGVVLWKVAGKDLLKIIFAPLIWLAVISIQLIVWFKCLGKKSEFKFYNDEGRSAFMSIQGAMFTAITITCICVFFA